jgi:hypothetical protein
MKMSFRHLRVLLLASWLPRAWADCTSYGVDYSNGGSYYIDGSSNQYFSFITVFQGMCRRPCVLAWPVGWRFSLTQYLSFL